MRNIVDKIHNRILKASFQPIRVFVFHHVSAECDPLVCQQEDWTQLDQFKRNIERLSQNYTFISLSEAYHKLQRDKIRSRKYAVLTTDDGLASVLNVITWLEEKRIPLTLFINTRYMEGNILKPVHEKWLREIDSNADMKAIAKKMYLSEKQIWSLNSPLIEIGMHGHEHLNVSQITESQFEEDINTCMLKLRNHPRFISACAFPWGKSTDDSMIYLHQNHIIPVVVHGGKNYKWIGYIDRESIDNKTL